MACCPALRIEEPRDLKVVQDMPEWEAALPPSRDPSLVGLWDIQTPQIESCMAESPDPSLLACSLVMHEKRKIARQHPVKKVASAAPVG